MAHLLLVSGGTRRRDHREGKVTPDSALARLEHLAVHHKNGLLHVTDYRREAAIVLLRMAEYVRDVTLDDVQDKLNTLREDGS